MKEIQEIEISLSKSKLTLLLLGSVLLVALGLWFLIAPPSIDHPVYGNQTLLLLAGILATAFFGLTTIFIARKLMDNRPGLVIGKEGITDNSSAVAAGLIKWDDLEYFSVLKISGQKLIMLFVKNPQDYIDRQTSGFKKRAMKMNFKMYQTPLSISANGLKCNFDELLGMLESNFEISQNN